MDIKERIQNIWKSIGGVEDIYDLPQERRNELWLVARAYYRRYDTSVESGVYSRARWRRGSRALFCVIKSCNTDEEILKKLTELRDRAKATRLEQIASEQAAVQQQQEHEHRVAEDKKNWVAAVRVAFGGSPDKELSEELKPKAFANHVLLKAGVSQEITIKLPLFFEERAEFLAELDALIANQTWFKHGTH
jgi:hypothetical protein